MPTPRIPLHHQLRTHTASAHQRVDAALGGGLHDADDCVAYARGMAMFLDSAAAVLGGSHALLAHAHQALSADLGARLPAFGQTPDRDCARRIGWDYVVSGSTLGARLLLRQARKADAGSPHHFLAAFAGSDAWLRFLRDLEPVRMDGAARDRACSAALEAFHCAEDAIARTRRAA